MPKLKATYYSIPLKLPKLRMRALSLSELWEESRKRDEARRREDNIQRTIDALAKASGATRRRA